MTTLFGATAYLEIGRPGEPGRRLPGLHTTFDFEKKDGAARNTARLLVTNPSIGTAALAQKDGAVAILYAGYGDDVGVCFVGEVTRATVTHQGPDRVLELESGDKIVDHTASIQGALRSQSLGLKDALGEVGKALGAVGVDVDAVEDSALSAGRGLVLQGSPRKQLRRLSRIRRFDWTMEDGELVIVPRGGASQDTAVVLEPGAGLIGSPAPGEKGRIEVTCQLRSVFRLRRIIEVRSRDYNGFFLIRRIKGSGDSGSGDLRCVLECSPIKVK